MWSGGAESSSRPASGGLPPIGAAVASHLAPAALPRLPAVFLVPMIFSSPIREGLSPARSQLPPPACGPLASRGRGKFWQCPGDGGDRTCSLETPPLVRLTQRPPQAAAGTAPAPAACAAAGILSSYPLQLERPGTSGSRPSWTTFFLTPCARSSSVQEVQEIPRPHYSAPRHGQTTTHPPTLRMLAVLDPSCVPLFHMTAARERWGSDWSVGLKSPSFLDSAPGATATTTSNVSLSPKHAVKCHLKGTTAGPLSSPQPSELLSRHHETQAGIPCHSAFFQG